MNSNLKTLTTVEAAKALGVSKSYLDQLRIYDPKQSPPFAKLGSRVVYPQAGLEAWFQKRIVNAGKQPAK